MQVPPPRGGRWRVRATPLALACLVAVAVAAGCGGSSGSGKSTATSASKAPTGTPITIGFLNSEGPGAAISNPEVTQAAQAAVDYVNGQLGGVAGRPLKLSPCATNGSPEASVTCTNRFLQQRVTAILVGTDTGVDSALPIAKGAGIPLIGLSAAAKTGVDPYYTQFAPPAAQALAGTFQVLRQQGKTNVVQLSPTVAGIQQVFDQYIKPAGAAARVTVSLATYNPAAPDFTSAMTAVKAKGADAISFGGAEPSCTSLVQAAKSVGFTGVVTVGTCSDFIKQLGAQAAGVETLSYLWVPLARSAAPPAKQRELAAYDAAMQSAGLGEKENGIAAFGFAGVVDVARALQQVQGAISPRSFQRALAGLKGFDGFLGQQSMDCADRPAQSSACGNGFLAYRVKSDGTLDAIGGDFIVVGATG